MPPSVASDVAADQMYRGGRETYHSFPSHKPRVSFVQAIQSIDRAGWAPTLAKQIVAEYALWSQMDEEPRPVWAVTLRGVPVFKPPPGTPKDTQDQYRHIVDADTGEWIGMNNNPRLDLSGLRAREVPVIAREIEGPPAEHD